MSKCLKIIIVSSDRIDFLWYYAYFSGDKIKSALNVGLCLSLQGNEERCYTARVMSHPIISLQSSTTSAVRLTDCWPEASQPAPPIYLYIYSSSHHKRLKCANMTSALLIHHPMRPC